VVCPAAADHSCAGPSWEVQGKSVYHAHLPEDPRYVLQTLITNLTGSTAYRIAAVAITATGVRTTRVISIKTVPDMDSTETVVLLSGGDYQTDSVGISMLRAGVRKAPDARVLLIGGDLSYANNHRTCFLRWDRFLRTVAVLVNGDGHHLILVTIPGNHEAGGYLAADSRSAYYFYTQYFPQFDDDEPSDATITYHSHLLGKHVGLIGLDSGTMVPVPDQVSYLDTQLRSMKGFDPTAIPTSTEIDATRFTIVAYHNAIFTAIDRTPADPVPLMEAMFVPILDKYRVPLALEFHDHVYKRTHPLVGGVAQEAGRGTVYIGDGALGVFDGTRGLMEYPYIAKSYSSNYLAVFRIYGNGTCAAEMVNAAGFGFTTLDSFTVQRRL
jgi:hypothetical protein